MTAPTYPPVLREPIASTAGPSFITNPMPETPPGGNAASIEGGFPPVTMTSELAGGKPPLGQDMNGFLFLLSSHLVYIQSGLPYLYDADVSTALGGYPEGCILGMADESGLWINTAAGNTTDPDSGTSFSAGWRAVYSYGSSSVVTTGGTIALSTAQQKKPVVVVTGTLTSNATLQFSPVAQEWLVVNATTGAFNLNVTAGGPTLNIPQGGFSSPLGIYGIGDGNLYPTVAPLSIPISQGPDPSTIAERTNAGYLLATYFNMSAPQNDGAPVLEIMTGASDGFIRRNTVAVVEAAMSLAGIGGQVTNGQVPLSAVVQYAANILASAALTGSPTAPTQAVGNATTLVASTAFVNPGSGVNGNGSFRKNPDGSIDQWGSFAFTANGGTVARTFPIAFPNALESIVVGAPFAPSGLGGAGSYQADLGPAAPSLSGFQYHSVSSSNPAIQVYWEAKGR